MGLKAVFFDLDDTLYTSFQAGDAYAYEKLEEWAISTFGDKGKGFADAFRVNRKRLARQQPAMPPTHDRVLFAQGALERMGLNAVRYSREAFRVYWDAVFAKMTLRPGVAEFLDELRAAGVKVAICTNMLADIQMEKLEYLGIADRWTALLRVRKPVWISRVRQFSGWRCTNAAVCRRRPSWLATTSRTIFRARSTSALTACGSTGRTSRNRSVSCPTPR